MHDNSSPFHPVNTEWPEVDHDLQPQPRPEPEPEPNRRSAWREALSFIGVLIAALLIALGLIAFVFQSYQVDGPSMENTLQNNDRLIVWKVPVTWSHITGHPYIPGRGDIIVFNQNGLSEFGQTDKKQLIKRVIGLPGDHVVIRDGDITIYNHAHPNGFDPDKTLPYGKNIPKTAGDIDITLGKDQLFVCGDNRPNSLDSRAFGPISAKDIVGKLILRILPVGKAKAF